jgi:hypothetical protein
MGRSDPVEDALAAGVRAIADAMTRAKRADLPVLADRLSTIATELEERRRAGGSNVVAFAASRRRSQ